MAQPKHGKMKDTKFTFPSGHIYKRVKPTNSLVSAWYDSDAQPHNPFSSFRRKRGHDFAVVGAPQLCMERPDPSMKEVEDVQFAFTAGRLNKLLNPKSLDAFRALSGLRGLEKGLRTNIHSGISADDTSFQATSKSDTQIRVEDTKFAFSPDQLNKLQNPKNLAAFHALGGLHGLEKGLRTNIHNGLSVNEEAVPCSTTRNPQESFADRKRLYGNNKLPKNRTKKPILERAWIACIDNKGLGLLTTAALISLALGIYQSISSTNETPICVVYAIATSITILSGVIVTALNQWQKEHQLAKLNQKKEDRYVKVIRSGKTTEISVHDILVGDVMHLEPGDLIPVDGVLIEGWNVRCDESPVTGKPDLLRKTAGDEVYRAIEQDDENILKKQDPFIVSGSKVCEGVGTFLVTSVGVNSTYGKIIMSLQDEGQTKDGGALIVNKEPGQRQTFTTGGQLIPNSWMNILLFAVPIGIALSWAEVTPVVVFLINFIAIIPLAAMLSYATEEITLWTGEALGGALNTGLQSINYLFSYLSDLLCEDQKRVRKSAFLPLIIGRKKLNAIPDTGADENAISTTCASQLGLTVQHDSNPVTFKLANGRCIESCGVAWASVSFAKGRNQSAIPDTMFRVFPTLAAPIIMGRKFLRDTRTLSKYDDRLETKVIHSSFFSAIPRIFHLNAAKQRLRCYLDGVPVYANADTGAEMNLASPKWAAKNGMIIRKPDRGYERVMLADGSLARISGRFFARFQVHSNTRRRPSKAYTREFFILEGLTSDVLLCQDLLLDIGAFKKHQKHAFIELGDAGSFSDLNFVSWLSKREKKFLRLFKRDPPIESLVHQDPETSFQEQMDVDAAREQDRHKQALRDISSQRRIPESEKSKRLAKENQRHNDFLRNFAKREREREPQALIMTGAHILTTST